MRWQTGALQTGRTLTVVAPPTPSPTPTSPTPLPGAARP